MPTLTIPRGGLRLLYITDLHLSASPLLRKRDALALGTLSSLLREARPHLAVFGGDFLSPIFTRSYTGNTRVQAKRLGEFMEGEGTPWCALPGNHDGAGCASLSEIFDYFSRLSCFLPLPIAPARGRNAVLPLYHGGREVHRLFLMDTHGRRGLFWDHVGEDQIAWFKNAAQDLPSTVLCHTPPRALALRAGRRNVREWGFLEAMKEAGTRLLLAGHHHGALAVHAPSQSLLLAYNPTMDHTVSFRAKGKRHGGSLVTYDSSGGASLCRLWQDGVGFFREEVAFLPSFEKKEAKI